MSGVDRQKVALGFASGLVAGVLLALLLGEVKWVLVCTLFGTAIGLAIVEEDTADDESERSAPNS